MSASRDRARPLACPKCPRRIRMRPMHGDYLTADACPGCHGFWFDEGELEALRDRLSSDTRWKKLDFWGMGDSTLFSPSRCECPKCDVPMSLLRYRAIEMEFCVNCGGVWLDAGEAREIIAALDAELNEIPSSALFMETLRQFLEIPVGSKGVVEEVRDFLAASRALSLRLAVENPDLVAKAAAVRSILPF